MCLTLSASWVRVPGAWFSPGLTDSWTPSRCCSISGSPTKASPSPNSTEPVAGVAEPSSSSSSSSCCCRISLRRQCEPKPLDGCARLPPPRGDAFQSSFGFGFCSQPKKQKRWNAAQKKKKKKGGIASFLPSSQLLLVPRVRREREELRRSAQPPVHQSWRMLSPRCLQWARQVLRLWHGHQSYLLCLVLSQLPEPRLRKDQSAISLAVHTHLLFYSTRQPQWDTAGTVPVPTNTPPNLSPSLLKMIWELGKNNTLPFSKECASPWQG